MDIGRRSILFGIGALSSVFAAATQVTTRDEVTDTVAEPYGASLLADTDKLKFESSIASQLRQAGLKVPQLELFEETSWIRQFFARMERSSAATNRAMGMGVPNFEGTMSLPEQGINKIPWLAKLIGADTATVLNIPPLGEDDFIDRATRDPSPNGILNRMCACGKQHSQLETQYPAFRVFVALHETAHYVDYAKKLREPLLEKITQGPQGNQNINLLYVNLGERIADAAATLYILSNYRDGRGLISAVSDWRDASSEPTHYSASTIKAAVKAFDNNPRRGLSIVEASEMTADIISKQGLNIVSEVQQASEAYNQLKSGKADPDAPAIKKAGLGRRNLFSTQPSNG